jgi:hypothetical protein
MRLTAALPMLLAAAPPPLPPPATPETGITRINAAPAREGWFVCDAIAGPYALFAGKPDAAGTSVITLLDRRSGHFDTQSYQVGPADPGAGQVYWPLSQGGKPAGSVHGVNPEMIEDGGATAPPIVGVEIGGQHLECRFLSHTRFLGLDSRRSVVVTEGPQGLVYQSFDYRRRGAVTRPDGVQRSNVPSLKLGGGTESVDPAGFRFTNTAGYDYALRWPAGTGAAALTVTRGGRTIGIDHLVGFTFAPPAPLAAAAAPAGLDMVWSGKDLDACRASQSAAVIDACLIATMRRTGAAPATIAFTQRLIAKGDAGYVSAWKQVGAIGIATVTWPFRANTNTGTMLIPAAGDPIDADGYELTAADKARADYRAAQAQHPGAFAVPPGDVTVKPGTDGGTRILVTTATADCHACAPNGSIVIAYDFDATGHFLHAGLVLAA